MKTAIEFNCRPVSLIWTPRAGNELFDEDGASIEYGETISICSWCSQDLTADLTKAGYTVSHGICESCSANELKKLNK